MPFDAQARKILVIVSVLLVAAAVVAYNITDVDTLPEQLEKLHEIEPHDLEGLRLATWTVSGSSVHATYEGTGGSNWFTLTVFETEERAREWFEDLRRALSDEDEVQQINTFDGSEYCAAVGGATRCIGWDGNRTFEGFTSGVGNFDRELDALLLTRTARKHWYRIYR